MASTSPTIHHDRIALVAITRHGIAVLGRVARALPGAFLFAPVKFRDVAETAAPGMAVCYTGKTSEQIPHLFRRFDGIVAVISLGAMVRLVAPHLRDKESDPGVVVLDEAGRYAVPMLSGHLGGANALAAMVADVIGAQPVLTTASDARQTLAVDLLGRELGWIFDATKPVLVKTSAAVVNDEPVAVVQEAGSTDWWRGHATGRSAPLPGNIQVFHHTDAIDPRRHNAVLWVTHRDACDLPTSLHAAIADRLVIYRPPAKASA